MSITQDGWTPLITAAYYGKCDVVSELLLEGAVVDAQQDVSHYTLFYHPLSSCTCTIEIYGNPLYTFDKGKCIHISRSATDLGKSDQGLCLLKG